MTDIVRACLQTSVMPQVFGFLSLTIEDVDEESAYAGRSSVSHRRPSRTLVLAQAESLG